MWKVLGDLQQLGMDFVDLVLLHGPNLAADNVGGCTAEACAFNRAQWQAFSELREEGRVRSIGLSNYCPSCLECLLDSESDGEVVIPAVNQVQYHVGYAAANYSAFVSDFASRGIVTWVRSHPK